MNNNELSFLLERLTALHRYEIRKIASQYQLHPVHLDALNYLSQCNAFSDTATGVQHFLCLTKGTTSQSINLLVKKKALIKEIDPQDQRIQHLKPTLFGRYLVAKAQNTPFERASHAHLSTEKTPKLAHCLQTLLRETQVQNRLSGFGICHTCRFHQAKDHQHFYCQLAKKTLKSTQAHLLCKEHQPPDD